MYTLFMSLMLVVQTSIYSHTITNTDGQSLPLSAYQGKKILLVNIATGSGRVSQLAGLQQLHQQYGDSLVIIAFPSNSFGNEARSNAEIKQFCQSSYGATFIIAAKNPITGSGAQPVYNWLGHASENGDTDIAIAGDFQKILIDKDGYIIGIYGPSVSPVDNSIRTAIEN